MKKSGFTLVEIMIVVCIIGMLGAIALPSMREARKVAMAAIIVNDLRVVTDGINMYSFDHGTYPQWWPMPPAPPEPAWDPWMPTLPAPLKGYIHKEDWEQLPYDGARFEYWGGVWIMIWGLESEGVVELVDEQMDYGKPWDGKMGYVPGWPIGKYDLWYQFAEW